MRILFLTGTFLLAASLGQEAQAQSQITDDCSTLFMTNQAVIDILADFGLDWEDAVPTGNVDRANASGDYDFQELMQLLESNDASDCKKYLVEVDVVVSPA